MSKKKLTKADEQYLAWKQAKERATKNDQTNLEREENDDRTQIETITISNGQGFIWLKPNGKHEVRVHLGKDVKKLGYTQLLCIGLYKCMGNDKWTEKLVKRTYTWLDDKLNNNNEKEKK